MKKKFVLSIVVFMLSSVSYAEGTVTCAGTVDKIQYHIPGVYYLKLSSMNQAVAFCSSESNWAPAGESRTITPETCKQLYSTFLSAKMAGKEFSVVYFDGDDVPTSCNTWGDWKSASVRFFSF